MASLKHLPKHTGEKRYICIKYGELYKSKLGFKDPIKRHNNVYDHHCNKCEARFVSKGTLKQHRLIMHMISKAIVCEECGKRFNYKLHYKEHLTSHTREKYIKCHIGNKLSHTFSYCIAIQLYPVILMKNRVILEIYSVISSNIGHQISHIKKMGHQISHI